MTTTAPDTHPADEHTDPLTLTVADLLSAHSWQPISEQPGWWTRPPERPAQYATGAALLPLVDDLAALDHDDAGTPELWAAFTAAVGELSEPTEAATAEVVTKSGQRYSYSYLTLPQLSELVRAAFARHGLAFRQSLTTTDHGVRVTTTIVHSSGACWTTEPLTLRPASSSPQDIGSASTYVRRYQLAALVGLSGADDDDAASQTHAPAQHAQQPARQDRQQQRGPQPMTDAQRRMIWASARGVGYGDPAELAAWAAGQLGVELDAAHPDQLLGSLTKAEASRLIDELRKLPAVIRSQPAEPDPGDPWASEPAEPAGVQ